MTPPPFSVLMSLYIKENPSFLDQCLASIYSQTLRANEIVIVLDGPISKALEATIERWRPKLPLKILPQEKNQGLGIALNVGLQACKYELVMRMDTDDICVPDRFSTQLKYLEAHPETDILSCYIEEFDSVPGDLKQIRKVPKKTEVNSYIKFRNPINHMGALYKKTKILGIGSYKDMPSMEDYYLWLRAIKGGLVIDNIQETLVYARVGNGMLTRRGGLSYIKSEYLLLKAKKHSLSISNIELLLTFALRIATRVSPLLLKLVYKYLRRHAYE